MTDTRLRPTSTLPLLPAVTGCTAPPAKGTHWDARRSLLAILAIALLMAVAVSFLPENDYLRYQQLDNTEYRNLRWIYERTHFDPQPIDIAFIGSSRIASGVDADQLEQALRSDGRRLNVENLGIPAVGRNLHLEITRELLAHKHPKLLVISVLERPGQHTHPVFKYIASSHDVVESIRYGNFEYFADLIYLPYRHLKLLWVQLFPSAGGGALRKFVDPVEQLQFGFTREPGGRWRVRYPQRNLAELERGARRARAQDAADPLARVPWTAALTAERRNVEAITTLAKAQGVKVVFIFMPQFMGDGTIAERDFYSAHGSFITADFLSTHPEYYSSWGHLNDAGMAALTTWLGRELRDDGLLQRAPDRAPPAVPGTAPRPRIGPTT